MCTEMLLWGLIGSISWFGDPFVFWGAVLALSQLGNFWGVHFPIFTASHNARMRSDIKATLSESPPAVAQGWAAYCCLG